MQLDVAREALQFALDVLTRLKPGEALGANRLRALRQRLDIVRGRESTSSRAISEAQSALMAVFGHISALNETSPVASKTRDELRTRLQNAVDGLPTQL